MSEQKTKQKEPSLRKPEKFILDATAGFRMMWFNKKHPNCIYLDNRPECEPDIIGDFRDLKEFPDETFKLIVFDPPHIFREHHITSNMIRAFGSLHPDTWQFDLMQAFSELWRVLKPYGVLLFKWNTSNASSDKVLMLSKVKPLFYQISSKIHAPSKSAGGGSSIQTLWFCFMKIPKENGGV